MGKLSGVPAILPWIVIIAFCLKDIPPVRIIFLLKEVTMGIIPIQAIPDTNLQQLLQNVLPSLILSPKRMLVVSLGMTERLR
ncbi:hypothetical protein IX307_002849 [Bacteroides pyogenes]|nr:hypothetical protein [Bacteroides pyogenes]MBR8793972.1 hypothetical protein [Bacteroides pyogenes]